MQQVKLSKFRFAALIGWISGRTGRDFDMEDLHQLDDMLIFDIPEVKYVEASMVDDLLSAINRDNGFIEAIKAYRALTGAGLKEAKEAIEKYRSFSEAHKIDNSHKDNAEATLGDILNHATGRNKAGNDISGI